VLSPATAKIDRSEKMPIYAGLGVPYCWMIDPLLQTLETYRLHEGHWLLQHSLKDDDRVCADPFAEHTFDLSNLWG
jgi:Uma2 family endonuclease